MVSQHIFLKGKNLAVIEVAGFIELAVLPPLELDLLLGGGAQCSLVALDGPVFLSQLVRHEILDVLNQADAPGHLFLAQAGVLVRLILINFHKLVKVH